MLTASYARIEHVEAQARSMNSITGTVNTALAYLYLVAR